MKDRRDGLSMFSMAAITMSMQSFDVKKHRRLRQLLPAPDCSSFGLPKPSFERTDVERNVIR